MKLETENKSLRDIVADIVLIDTALDQLKQVVADVVNKLEAIESGVLPIEADAEVITNDETGQAPAGPQESRYQVTELGADKPAVPYRVDTKQFIGGGDF